jgi:flavodoxin
LKAQQKIKNKEIQLMKTIVIFNSQTGFTKRYAEWIAEAAGADCLELSAAKKKGIRKPRPSR